MARPWKLAGWILPPIIHHSILIANHRISPGMVLLREKTAGKEDRGWRGRTETRCAPFSNSDDNSGRRSRRGNAKCRMLQRDLSVVNGFLLCIQRFHYQRHGHSTTSLGGLGHPNVTPVTCLSYSTRKRLPVHDLFGSHDCRHVCMPCECRVLRVLHPQHFSEVIKSL